MNAGLRERQLRRALARQLAAEHRVPFPVAFAAVRIGADRCRALAAELLWTPSVAGQRTSARRPSRRSRRASTRST